MKAKIMAEVKTAFPSRKPDVVCNHQSAAFCNAAIVAQGAEGNAEQKSTKRK